MTGHKQTTDSTDYTTAYVYNLGGALIEETYPSGSVVKNTLDSTGDLAMVQSKKNTASGYWSYADSFTYNAAGAVTSMQLGNGSGKARYSIQGYSRRRLLWGRFKAGLINSN